MDDARENGVTCREEDGEESGEEKVIGSGRLCTGDGQGEGDREAAGTGVTARTGSETSSETGAGAGADASMATSISSSSLTMGMTGVSSTSMASSRLNATGPSSG
jgi:hypothetical protein